MRFVDRVNYLLVSLELRASASQPTRLRRIRWKALLLCLLIALFTGIRLYKGQIHGTGDKVMWIVFNGLLLMLCLGRIIYATRLLRLPRGRT